MFRLHADTDANVVLDPEPASGHDEHTLILPQLVRQILGRHVEVVAKESHAAGGGTLPGPAVPLLDPALDDVGILAQEGAPARQDALAVLRLHDGRSEDLAQDPA